MTRFGRVADDPRDRPFSRRRYLAATGAAVAAGLAGCSGTVTHTFEATPVRIPWADQADLPVSRIAFDASTTTVRDEVGDVDGEVRITSYVAAYRRGPARGVPTAMDTCLAGVNGTLGAGPAAVWSPDAGGVPEVTLAAFGEAPTVPGDRIGLVVPSGAVATTDDATVTLDRGAVLAVVPGRAVARDGRSLTVDAPNAALLPVGTVFPNHRWEYASPRVPSPRWIPGTGRDDGGFPPDTSGEGRVLVTTGQRSFADVFGVPVTAAGGRPVRAGEEVSPEVLRNGTIVTVADEPARRPLFPDGVLSEAAASGGRVSAAPTSGATFGLGVLATPKAEVAGRSANPVAGMDLEELLPSAWAGRILRRVGVTDADAVEWLREPREVTSEVGERPSATIPGAGSVDVRTFAGAVGGGGAFDLGIHLARAERDGDVVVVGGIQRTPLVPGGAPPAPDDGWYARGVRTTAAILGRLATGAPPALGGSGEPGTTQEVALPDCGSTGGDADTTSTDASTDDGTDSYDVEEGDTIWNLSNEEYGEPTKWKLIAEESGIDEPESIRAGPTVAAAESDDAEATVDLYFPEAVPPTIERVAAYLDADLRAREEVTEAARGSGEVSVDFDFGDVSPGRHAISIEVTGGDRRCYHGAFRVVPTDGSGGDGG